LGLPFLPVGFGYFTGWLWVIWIVGLDWIESEFVSLFMVMMGGRVCGGVSGWRCGVKLGERGTETTRMSELMSFLPLLLS
jgi:hypothetical protein